ncbi:hypothetical protein EDD15DRAFT_2131536, partial [Pisolithus albus]
TLTGHSRAINVVRFSSDGNCTISGGDDGRVLICNVRRKKVLKTHQGPVIGVEWIEQLENPGVVTAGADGILKLWKKVFTMSNSLTFEFASIFPLFETPVKNSTLDDGHRLFAACSGRRIATIAINLGSPCPFHEISFYPPKTSPRHLGLAQTVHFLDDGKSIMTGFLDSKDLYSWTVSPWRENWHAKLSTRIGNTAWSAATRLLLVWNLVDGVDMYHIVEHLVFVRKLRVTFGRMYVCQVDFGCQGLLAASEMDRGKVCIWNINSVGQAMVLSHG